jgi:hypothetical protein
MNYIVTLVPGSGIGSIIVGILAALLYLKENNINNVLLVNCYFASEPVKAFIDCFLDKDRIKCINFVHIYNNFYKPNYSEGDHYKELFFVKETSNVYHRLVGEFNKYIELFNTVWILKPFVKNECAHLDKYDICINIRRGDKVKLEPHLPIVNIDSYINEIKKINIKNPKIFHTSDEYNSFLEIKSKNADWNISTLTSPEENGYFLEEINKKDSAYNVNHVLKFMKQLHIMKNSEYFIGSLSTNVGFIVQLLRETKNNNKNIYL